MAAGLPVVASAVGGLPEALTHGGGILVPPNDPERLADALAILLTDEKQRRHMGTCARSVVEKHFLWSNVRQQYLAALEGSPA
jgi:glycosyltransferase involved in cell wall biosynthesis